MYIKQITFLLIWCAIGSVQAQKQICISIDDLPIASQVYQTAGAQDSLTKRLLSQLKQHNVPAIGFVIGQNLIEHNHLDKDKVALLQQWLLAGIELGNHTFAHKGYNDISAVEYQQDVAGADSLLALFLKSYRQRPHFFRHPFLQRGNTRGKQDSLVAYLRKHQYEEAPVTIDNSDYLFSAAYEIALAHKNSVLADSIGRSYVNYMLNYVHYYEAQADSLFKRPIAHILLTHANSINSFYLGAILSTLKTEGYSFIPLHEALQDSAYKSADKYTGNGGISWLHRWALTQGKRGSFYKGEPEAPVFITNLIDQK